MSPKNVSNRRLALQIAAQLPENREDALAVLTYAAEIVRGIHEGFVPARGSGSGGAGAGSGSGSGNGNGGGGGEQSASGTVVGLFR